MIDIFVRLKIIINTIQQLGRVKIVDRRERKQKRKQFSKLLIQASYYNQGLAVLCLY